MRLLALAKQNEELTSMLASKDLNRDALANDIKRTNAQQLFNTKQRYTIQQRLLDEFVKAKSILCSTFNIAEESIPDDLTSLTLRSGTSSKQRSKSAPKQATYSSRHDLPSNKNAGEANVSRGGVTSNVKTTVAVTCSSAGGAHSVSASGTATPGKPCRKGAIIRQGKLSIFSENNLDQLTIHMASPVRSREITNYTAPSPLLVAENSLASLDLD